MPYRDFPPIYGAYDSGSLYDEDKLRQLLGLGQEDSCADWYEHYRRCDHAVVEGKSRNLRNAIGQVQNTIQRLRALNPSREVNRAIIVADSFQNRLGMHRKSNKQLWQKVGKDDRPIHGDTTRKDIIIEGWQPNEWGRETLGY